MVYRENPLLGRKVFFLNPPLSVENNIIESLKDEEYEVYVIRDYMTAKPVLKLYENTICFIFIDDVLSLDAWFNFIKSFEMDPSLQSVFLGVLSVKTKPKDQERFLMNLKLPGGFVMMDKKNEEVYEQLEGILRINGAKGVRKCIRLELKDSKEVNGYFALGSQLFSFRLIDISSMGFAALTPAKMAPIFKTGGIIKNISITMGRYSFVCSAKIVNAKVNGDNCVVVAMLVEETSKDVRLKIHNFVYETLETRNKILTNEITRDFTDYNIRIKTENNSTSENQQDEQTSAENAEEVEAVEEVETVEEIEEVASEESSSNDTPSDDTPSNDN